MTPARQSPVGTRVAAKIALDEIRLRHAQFQLFDIPEQIDVVIDVQHRVGWGRQDDKFAVEVGIRALVLPVGGGDEDAAVVEVVADHVLGYRIPEDFEASDEEFEAFAQSSAVLTAWPYGREVIHSLAGRAGFPQVVVPTFKVTLPGPGDSAGSPPPKAQSKKAGPKKKAAPKKKTAKNSASKGTVVKKRAQKPTRQGPK